MADFVNNIEVLQYKAPKHLPDANSKHINSAEQTNACLTQQIRNAMELSGVVRPTSLVRSDEVDPLFLSKSIQQQAMFAQSYGIDASSTANNIIIIPAVQDKQLSTVKLDDNGTEITPTETNVVGTVDGQVFDEIQNGSIFQFIPTFNNTSSTVNLTVRIKHLKWDSGTNTQIVETKNFTYPVKAIDGVSDININNITQSRHTIVQFDAGLEVFKLLNIAEATTTSKGLSYLDSQIKLTYNTPTSLLYSSGTFNFDDGSGSSVITASGAINFVGLVANTSYYVFAIHNPTTNISQMHYDISRNSPTLPVGFTKKKYVGALRTNASLQIRSGTYIYGKGYYEFYYTTRIEDRYASLPPLGTGLYPISVPTTNSVIAITVLMANAGNEGGDTMKGNFGSPNEVFAVTDEDQVDFAAIGDACRIQEVDKDFPTSTSQVQIQVTASTLARNYSLYTRGWRELI